MKATSPSATDDVEINSAEFPPIKVLYIEDDIVLALLMQERLDQYGYSVDLAKDGHEGLAKLREQTYDLVAIDYRLPGMDGLQVLRKLTESNLRVPAIMVTGEGSEQLAVAVMKLGASDYLIKDSEGDFFKRLPSVIERVVEKQRLLDEKLRNEKALHERDTILEAVSFAAEKFLTATHWAEPIQSVLARLGKAALASRVYIFENIKTTTGANFQDTYPSYTTINHRLLNNRKAKRLLPTINPIATPITATSITPTTSLATDSNLLVSQRYEWVAPGISSQSDNPQLQNSPYYPSFARWVEQLSQGHAIYGKIADFPLSERAILANQNILAIAIVPIFVGTTWWGFIGYDDCWMAREWSTVVIEAFKIAARILGAAIQHEHITQALRQSEAHLLQTQRIAHLGHCEWDIANNSRWLSEETLRIFGFPLNNHLISNEAFLNTIHSEDRKVLQQAVEKTIYSNQPYDIEFRIIRQDGTQRDVHTIAELIRDDKGKPIRFMGTTQDITEHKQVERALRESTQTLSAILNAATDSIVMTETDTTCVIINPAGAARLNRTVAEVIGQPLCQLVSPTIGAKRKKFFQQVVATKQSLLFEDEENTVWFEHSVYPVLDKNERVTRIAIVSRDITNRKQAEKALLESKRRYESIFNSTEVAIWEADFSKVLLALKQLEVGDTEELRHYLQSKRTWQLIRLIMVNDINRITLKMFGAQNKRELMESLPKIFAATAMETFIDGLCALWEGKQSAWQTDLQLNTLDGHRLTAILSMPIPTTIPEARRVPASLLDITELKRVEEALRRERDFTDAILNTAGSLIVVMDREGRIIRFNRTCEKLTGYSFNEINHHYVWEFFLSRDEFENVKNYFNDLHSLHSPLRYENYWQTKTGQFHLIDWSNTILINDYHELEYVIATGIDITERNQAELALARTLAELQVILDNSPVAIAFLTAEHQFVHINRKLEEMFGYSETELKGQTTKILYDNQEDYENDVSTATYHLLKNDATYETEHLLRRQDGSLFWCRFLIKAIDPHNPSQGYIWNLEDVTEQKRAEENLRLAAKVFETTNESIIVTDANNNIIMINPAFTNITGYLFEEVIGKRPNFLSAGHHNLQFYQIIWKTLKDTGKWQGELWERRKNGEVYVAWTSISAVRDENNQITQHVYISTDITKRKQSEEVIWRQANYDALTGLPNRTLYADRLAHTIHTAKRQNRQLAVMFIDLDRFKWVNDTLGHDTGDRLLEETAQRLSNCIRESDTVARRGGDEFTVILPYIDSKNDVQTVAERILTSLSQPFLLANRKISIGSSIGIAIFPQDGQDAETLLKKSDLAMYQAKQAGRNTFRFYSNPN
jgi:diguanylate cyclase (GGDEF)-like protein/PAS domain S-box-containing protein